MFLHLLYLFLLRFFSCRCSSCSFKSCSFNPCNSFFVSFILHSSLYLYAFLKLRKRCVVLQSYEGIYIAKCGVALDIPLCDCSSILVTVPLLYDCYIQLSTLELPLDKTLHTMCTCTNVRQNRLEQAMQEITMTRKNVGIPALRHPHDGR